MDKLDIDKLKNVPSNSSNLKSKVDKLDVDKLVLVPINLSKLSDLVKNDVIKKDVYNVKIKKIENKILSITNLATTTTLNAVENKTPDHSKYITTPEFNMLTSENFSARLAQANLASKSDIANFVKKIDFDDKLKI